MKRRLGDVMTINMHIPVRTGTGSESRSGGNAGRRRSDACDQTISSVLRSPRALCVHSRCQSIGGGSCRALRSDVPRIDMVIDIVAHAGESMQVSTEGMKPATP